MEMGLFDVKGEENGCKLTGASFVSEVVPRPGLCYALGRADGERRVPWGPFWQHPCPCALQPAYCSATSCPCRPTGRGDQSAASWSAGGGATSRCWPC